MSLPPTAPVAKIYLKEDVVVRETSRSSFELRLTANDVYEMLSGPWSSFV